MSLLEKAKALPTDKRRIIIDEETMDLSIAWLKSEVTFTQIATVLKTQKNSKAGIYNFLCRNLRSAYIKEKIKVS